MNDPSTSAAPLSTPPGAGRQILVFQLAESRFGLPAADLCEVARSVETTWLPGAPSVVEGVVDLRGTLVPVFDLRERFGLPPRANHPSDRLVVARCRGRMVAVRVEGVHGLATIDPAGVQEAGSLVRGARHPVGIVRLPDGLVILHDLGAFLAAAEERELDQALAGVAVDGSGAP